MYSDDLQNDPLVSDQDDDSDAAADNLDLENVEADEDENAYLINDDEISEGFQFQN